MTYLNDLDQVIENTTIEQVAELLGLTEKLRKREGKVEVLWREDRNPSGGIWGDGRMMTDHTRDVSHDSLGCYAACRGMERKAAIPDFLREFGNGQPAPRKRKSESRTEKRRRWPTFDQGTQSDWQAVADLRGFNVRAVEWAVRSGLLAFCEWSNERAWIVTDRCLDTDGRPLNAQARRLDGLLWQKIEAKAWTLPGSRANHVVGLSHVGRYPCLLLCEGGPDLLAALHILHRDDKPDWGALTLLGASQSISDDEAEQLSGRLVRIVPHVDESGAGNAAAERWANTLHGHGAEVEVVTLDSGDLNDNIHLEVAS